MAPRLETAGLGTSRPPYANWRQRLPGRNLPILLAISCKKTGFLHRAKLETELWKQPPGPLNQPFPHRRGHILSLLTNRRKKLGVMSWPTTHRLLSE